MNLPSTTSSFTTTMPKRAQRSLIMTMHLLCSGLIGCVGSKVNKKMIGRIKLHNSINGFIFSVAEFSLFTLVILPFCFYYFLHKNLTLAFTTLGLICNFSMIIIFGIRSILRKEKGGSIKDLLNKTKRDAISQQYPNLSTDTLILVFTLLIPFLLFVIVIIELILLNKNKAVKRNPQRDREI